MGVEQTRAIFNKMRKVIFSNKRVRNFAVLRRIKNKKYIGRVMRGDKYLLLQTIIQDKTQGKRSNGESGINADRFTSSEKKLSKKIIKNENIPDDDQLP